MTDELELAQALRDADIARLVVLDGEQLDYLARVDVLPDPAGEGVEHDDGPHLTGDEWAYIVEVSGG